MEENSSVSEHILKMSGYCNHLIQLGVNLPDDSVIDRILQSLPPSYKSFVMNYNMQGMDKTIPELFAMLKAAEVEIKKEHQVLMVNKTTSFKKKGKGKKKGNFKKNTSKLLLRRRNPSLDLSLRLSASTASRLVTGSGTAPSIWRIRRMAR
uniref:Retrovirus-related Pol polyprotein from transposon TNT 1-94 n=1 Tax=Triticum urartu TaxID=4572 RepID=A0A8R7PR78_TRIUA